MVFWYSPQLAGFFCFSICVVLAIMLILWRSGRRMDCPGCHHRNPGHAHFCGHCGKNLGS